MAEQISYDPITPDDSVKVKLVKVLDYMYWYCETYPGTSPTIRNIQHALGVSSTSMTNYYLNKLVKQGKLMRIKGVCRGYVPVGGRWIRPTDPLTMMSNPSENG